MSSPTYYVDGSWLFKIIPYSIRETKKTWMFRCYGKFEPISLTKKRARGKLYHRKPRRW